MNINIEIAGAFDIGQEVWQSIDPEYTTSFDAAVECYILSVILDVDKNGPTIKEYVVAYHTFDEDTTISPERLFSNEADAIEATKKRISEKIEKLKERLEKYETIFGKLEDI